MGCQWMSQVLTVWLMVCVVLLGTLSGTADGALTAVYMPTSCGVMTSVSPSVQLESATGLTYTNNMDCSVTFNVTSPHLILANIKRFELEPQYSGTCNDYVNLHDGADVSAGTLNSDVLCGSSLTNSTYVTSGQQLTVRFVTDSTAVYLGFNIIVTAVLVAPCQTDQFQCNNTNYCIDSTLVCDDYGQCGDDSDEASCTKTTSSTSTNWVPVIVGVSLGLLAMALLIAFVLYRRHRRNHWRRFTTDLVTGDKDVVDDLPDLDPPAYPVTHKYFRGVRGHPPAELPRMYGGGVMVEEGEEEEKKKKAGVET
ncbi:uncharacterized protein LOC143285871 [Babylonia areolata]|uniref:uncharacterized protein LOC143285871 n=1 Tax=Babylonia areolata TaxID=304850 RepID=UPI003FCF633F